MVITKGVKDSKPHGAMPSARGELLNLDNNDKTPNTNADRVAH